MPYCFVCKNRCQGRGPRARQELPGFSGQNAGLFSCDCCWASVKEASNLSWTAEAHPYLPTWASITPRPSMPADSSAVHTFSPRSARRHLQPGVPQHKGTTQAQVRRASAPARPLSRVLTLPHPRPQAAVSAGAAQTAAGFLRPLQREAVALSTAPEIEALSHHTGVAISKFFAADTEARRLWISGVLGGIFAQQGPCELCAALGALVPQLSEEGAGQIALIAVSRIDAPELLVNLLVEALQSPPITLGTRNLAQIGAFRAQSEPSNHTRHAQPRSNWRTQGQIRALQSH
jgi:hypothetical protein